MSVKNETRFGRALKTAVPVVCVVLLMACPFLASLRDAGAVAWRKTTKVETGSIRVSFPPDVTKIRLRLHSPTDGGSPHIILAPSESGIETFWLNPGLSTPPPAPAPTSSAQDPKEGKPNNTKSLKKTGDGNGENKADPKDPPPPPWFACGPSVQTPESWPFSCTLEDSGTLLTIERSSVGTRADVWLLPVSEVSHVRVLPQTEIRWTQTVLFVKKEPKGNEKEVAIQAASCTGFDSAERPRSDLPECAPVRAVLGDVVAEPVASATHALANKIVYYENKYGSGLLSMMEFALWVVLVANLGAIVWHLTLIKRPNPAHAEAARLFRPFRWLLQWAEVVFPAIAFTLTTACLVVAFRRQQGPDGEAGFREGIGFALVATALGLVIRVLAHTADRMLENVAHHGADHDGIIRAPEEKKKKEEPPPKVAIQAQPPVREPPPTSGTQPAGQAQGGN